MRRLAALVAGLASLAASPLAQAAVPSINAAEDNVRLGLTAGYGSYEEDIQSPATEAGPAWGIAAGVSALSDSGLSRYGWPDLYTSVTYDFSAEYLNGRGRLPTPAASSYRASPHDNFNTAMVRLGLGRAILSGAELIPYVAGGYENWHRVGSGTGGYGAFYQTAVMGLGVKFDIVPARLWVISAAAEGFALTGGSVSEPAANFSGEIGTNAGERISLDADYRLHGAWHAFAGLGVTHYGYGSARSDATGLDEAAGSSLQVNSMFGITYGF